MNRNNDETIWHDRPAGEDWLRAMPLGNGRMGAMVFGNPVLERIQLNEDTFYALEPEDSGYLPQAVQEQLPGVIDLLRQGRYSEAEEQVARNWQGRSNAPYQPLADLWIECGHSGFSSYTHELSLRESLDTCTYTCGGETFIREAFMSFPDQVLAVRLHCNTPGSISISAWVDSPHKPTLVTKIEGTRFVAKGQSPGEALRRSPGKIRKWGDERKYPNFYEQNTDGSYRRKPGCENNVLYADAVDGKGMCFDVQLQVLPTGGTVTDKDGRLQVEGADEVLLLLSADTGFNGLDRSPSREGIDPSIQAKKDVDAASLKPFSELKNRHIQDIQALYNRVTFNLGNPGINAEMPTDIRVEKYGDGNDPTLPVLYYNFSRYLMIAGSRPGSEPLNLQGIWNQEVIPPWNGGYTTNINAEMNYWDVLRGNLTECHEPFLRMVQETYTNGKKTASEMFGCRGWCMFHNISIWRSAAPVDGIARTSWWPVGAGWFCQHLWHHYLMTQDSAFLSASFPILRDASLFFCDWLIDRGDGKWVTPVSTSPENVFFYQDENGVRLEAGISMGSTMDMSIIRETLTNTLSAAETLEIVVPEQDEIRESLSNLLDFQVAENGTLMEWSKAFEEGDPEHRHISHLYGFFPGEEITPEKRPELIDAVRATLERRGDGASGWSMGWKLNCWARLGDGGHFHQLLGNLLTPERTAPNLLCLHPPFQIDGNFGSARAITEALIQDHRGFIELLPALPPDWTEGKIKGLRCRGGLEVDLEWLNREVTRGVFRSEKGGVFDLRVKNRLKTITLEPGIPATSLFT